MRALWGPLLFLRCELIRQRMYSVAVCNRPGLCGSGNGPMDFENSMLLFSHCREAVGAPGVVPTLHRCWRESWLCGHNIDLSLESQVQPLLFAGESVSV